MSKLKTEKTCHHLNVGENSEGYSGSDIKVVVQEALMEPLRKCQTAKQFLVDAEGHYFPCEEYPHCPYCPMALHDPLIGVECIHPTNTLGVSCQTCGAIRMSLYDVPSDKLIVPLICYADFEKALKKAHSSVGVNELQRFVQWTEDFGQEG